MSSAGQSVFEDTFKRAQLSGRQAVAVWAAWIGALLLGVVGLVEVIPSGPANTVEVGVSLALILSTVTVGAVLVTRLPHHIVGWLLLTGGVTLAVSIGAAALADYGLNVHPGGVPGAVWFAILSGATGGSFVGLLAGFVPLYFPTGRLPSARWRPLVPMALVPTLSPVITSALGPLTPGTYPASVVNPLALDGLGGQLIAVLSTVSTLLGVVALLLVIASLVTRYRRAQGVERAQLKWFALLGLAVVPTFLVGILVPASGSLAILANAAWVIALGGLALLPVAIGFAILRYRLYEIDRIISRSISWAAVTLIVGGLFVALILVLQVLISPLTRSNEPAVVGSTLLVFSLFQAIRRRVQRLVDRRFNRSRYDSERTVAAFSGRLRDEIDLEALRAEIVVTITQAIEPTSLSLWLRE